MQSVLYKVLTFISFGLAGFCLNRHSFQLGGFALFEVTLLMWVIFPLMIALAWGRRYGLWSAVAGGCQSILWGWASDGYGVFEILSSTFTPNDFFQGSLFFLGCCVSGLFISGLLSQNNKTKVALEASEKRYCTIIETTCEGYWRLDADTRTIEVNDAMCAMLGYEREEILGKSPLEFVDQEKRCFLTAQFENLRAFRHQRYNRTMKKKDATPCSVRINATTLRDDSDALKGYVALVTDLTDVRYAREVLKRLAQAQKMESIGTLAGGIAHEFNNILFPLIGYAELLKSDLADDSPHHHYIDEVLHAALRAKDLVSQILTFSRPAEGEIKSLRLYLVVKEVLKLLRSTIPKTITIQSHLDSHCGLVAADPTQVHQVLMNLATNAFHAMETSGGCLDVSLKQVTMDADESVFFELPAGDYAQLTVTDTGTGIDKNILNNIFEPDFTTKDENKGTGLGLALVHGIVRQSKGNIRVYSEPGRGTEVHVYFPVIQSRRTGESQKAPAPIQGGMESVLLVDDEEPIINMAQDLLRRLGYHVTPFTDGREALERFKAAPDDFDLVFTDMTMPGMTGIQLAKTIKEIRPDLPIVLSTGFSHQMNEETGRKMGIDGFVLKPLMKRDMAAIIRKVLGKSFDYESQRAG